MAEAANQRAGKGHKVWPCLLRDRPIGKPNEVRAANICYIPMAKGFMYRVAVMDWHSHRVLSWRVSNTLGTGFYEKMDSSDDCIALVDRNATEFNTVSGEGNTIDIHTPSVNWYVHAFLRVSPKTPNHRVDERMAGESNGRGVSASLWAHV